MRLSAASATACGAALALALRAPVASALPFTISNVFGDHMVIQRDRPAPVWGWGAAGASVAVSIDSGSPYTTTADSTGFWRVVLPAMPASFSPHTIVATSGTDSQTLQDVLAGDVIFTFGQSNSEFTTNSVFNSTAEVQLANNYPFIRLMSGPEQGLFNLNNVTAGPYEQLAVTNLAWSVASNVTVGCLVPGCSGWNYFSAIGWFVARDTFDLLGGTVPIGAIAQTYGGTSIQWWSSSDAIAACPAAPGSACCNYGGSNSCLWDSQVAPFLLGPTQLAAAQYYQGEQNAGCGGAPQIDYYSCALPALITDMRAKFQQPSLPFGIFLLAAWEQATPYFPLVRLIQVSTSSTLPNAFTASTLDYGEPAGGPVHSPYKQEPSRRAALALQSILYNRTSVAYRGPRYTGATASGPASGGGSITVTVSFDPSSLYEAPLVLNTSVACPSTITASSCEAFAIQTAPDCGWYAGAGNVTAAVSSDGGSLLLTLTLPPNLPAGTTAVATRGLFGNWPIVQLYNVPGFPAEPWLANVSGVTNNCPSPWNTTSFDETWVDTGVHA